MGWNLSWRTCYCRCICVFDHWENACRHTSFPQRDSFIDQIAAWLPPLHFRDITERKISHLQLIESEKRFSELFRLNPQPIWVFEPDTLRFVQVNKAATDLYGYSEEEFLNMTAFEVRPPEDMLLFRKALENYSGEENYVSGTIHSSNEIRKEN